MLNATRKWPTCGSVSRLKRPSKSASMPAPVALLVSHGVVGGGDNLPSGDPHTSLPCLFNKKKSIYKIVTLIGLV